MLEWNCITGCYEIEIPEHLKFYTTQKKNVITLPVPVTVTN